MKWNYRTKITYIDEDGVVIDETEIHKYIVIRKIKEGVVEENRLTRVIHYTYILRLNNQLKLF